MTNESNWIVTGNWVTDVRTLLANSASTDTLQYLSILFIIYITHVRETN